MYNIILFFFYIFGRTKRGNISNKIIKVMKFRKINKYLKDQQMDYYIEKFQNKKILDIISKYGDIDYPSKVALKLIKKSP